jgi:hypothetical protein
VRPNFVKYFDKALSKYCLFDLFSAIKHKRKEIRRNSIMEFDTFFDAFDLNCRLVCLDRAIFKTIVYVNLQPIKIFHDADQQSDLPSTRWTGIPQFRQVLCRALFKTRRLLRRSHGLENDDIRAMVQ